MLHPDVEQAMDQIDAAIYSGDAGGREGIEKLSEACSRWLALLEMMEMELDQEEDDDDC